MATPLICLKISPENVKQLSVKTSSAKRSSVSVEGSLTMRWSKKYLSAKSPSLFGITVYREVDTKLLKILNSMQRSTKISHKLIKKLSKTPLTNSFWNKNCHQQPAIFSSPRLKHLHFTSKRKSTNLTTPVARSFLPAVAQQNSFPAF